MGPARSAPRAGRGPASGDVVKPHQLVPLALLLAGPLAVIACGDDKDDTGPEDTDTDTDSDADTDTDTDTDTQPDYTIYEGHETFDFGWGLGIGYRDCQARWDASGTPITPCAGCAFAFEVYLEYDAEGSFGDGCEAYAIDVDATYDYAYAADYPDYGSVLMLSYQGYWYPWTTAEFDGSTFTYSWGYEDYPYDGDGKYPGYYQTYFWAGEAVVQ